MQSTFTENQSLRVNGSCVLFLRPFLPLERRLFLKQNQQLILESPARDLMCEMGFTYLPTAIDVVLEISFYQTLGYLSSLCEALEYFSLVGINKRIYRYLQRQPYGVLRRCTTKLPT